jgi:hypothetical protein
MNQLAKLAFSITSKLAVINFNLSWAGAHIQGVKNTIVFIGLLQNKPILNMKYFR